MRDLAIVLMACALPAASADFFPIAVWYGGGKARAPMLERDARAKKEIWRKDVRQIKAPGFNTVRTWIDWATGEPKVFLQVYMDSAPRWVGVRYPDSLRSEEHTSELQS